MDAHLHTYLFAQFYSTVSRPSYRLLDRMLTSVINIFIFNLRFFFIFFMYIMFIVLEDILS